MHENVPNLDTILVQCTASVTVKFASLTQEKMCTDPERHLESQITNSLSNINLKTFIHSNAIILLCFSGRGRK